MQVMFQVRCWRRRDRRNIISVGGVVVKEIGWLWIVGRVVVIITIIQISTTCSRLDKIASDLSWLTWYSYMRLFDLDKKARCLLSVLVMSSKEMDGCESVAGFLSSLGDGERSTLMLSLCIKLDTTASSFSKEEVGGVWWDNRDSVAPSPTMCGAINSVLHLRVA